MSLICKYLEVQTKTNLNMNNYKLTTFFVCMLLTFSTSTFAQLNTPRGSQQATVSQRIGVSDVSITYSRPSVKGREVWGKLK